MRNSEDEEQYVCKFEFKRSLSRQTEHRNKVTNSGYRMNKHRVGPVVSHESASKRPPEAPPQIEENRASPFVQIERRSKRHS